MASKDIVIIAQEDTGIAGEGLAVVVKWDKNWQDASDQQIAYLMKQMTNTLMKQMRVKEQEKSFGIDTPTK